MTIRPRFRPPAAMLAAFGLLAAPAILPNISLQTVASQQQQKDGKQGAIAVTQVPAPAIAIDRHAFMGYTMRHPVWIGRSKAGRGRKAGLRAKWDYRR